MNLMRIRNLGSVMNLPAVMLMFFENIQKHTTICSFNNGITDERHFGTHGSNYLHTPWRRPINQNLMRVIHTSQYNKKTFTQGRTRNLLREEFAQRLDNVTLE